MRLLTICPKMGVLIGGGDCCLRCNAFFGKDKQQQIVKCREFVFEPTLLRDNRYYKHGKPKEESK